jgi:hypothetical protein
VLRLFHLVSVGFIAMQNFGIASMMSLYGISAALASASLTSYLLGGAAGILAAASSRRTPRATTWSRYAAWR